MENENRRARKEHVNAERKRLIKLTETAYNNDPRIQRELRVLEEAKQRQKQAKWEFKQQQKQAELEMQRRHEEEKLNAERAEQERIKAEEDAKKQKQIAYKQRVKDLIELCQAKLPGTRYDKFWVESLLKKYNTVEKMNSIVDALNAVDPNLPPAEFLTVFEGAFALINQTEAEKAERARKEAQ